MRNTHRLVVEILSPVAHVFIKQVMEGEKHLAPCIEVYPPDVQRKPEGLCHGLAVVIRWVG